MQRSMIWMTLFAAGTSLLAVPSLAHAQAQAGSAGGLQVDTDTDFFLPLTATGDICLFAKAGAGPLGQFNGSHGLPHSCQIQGQPPFAGLFNGEGYINIPKFPETSVAGTMVDTDNRIFANSAANWTSDEGFLFNDADHNVMANVVRSNAFAPLGQALAESKDPWFFKPAEPTTLTVSIVLTDIELFASSSDGLGAFSAFFADAAFGVGEVAGENVLFSNTFSASVFAGDDPINLRRVPLLEFEVLLEPGETFWLTANVTSAAKAIPGPASWMLLGIATFAGRGGRRRGAEKVSGAEKEQKRCQDEFSEPLRPRK